MKNRTQTPQPMTVPFSAQSAGMPKENHPTPLCLVITPEPISNPEKRGLNPLVKYLRKKPRYTQELKKCASLSRPFQFFQLPSPKTPLTQPKIRPKNKTLYQTNLLNATHFEPPPYSNSRLQSQSSRPYPYNRHF